MHNKTNEKQFDEQLIQQLYRLPEALREIVASRLRGIDEENKLNDYSWLNEIFKLGLRPLTSADAAVLSSQDYKEAITIFDAHYPQLLIQSYAPPLVLFVRGELADNKARHAPCLAMVGARKAQPRILAFVERIAEALAERDVVVVSGLAYGVDAAAHRGALAAQGGKTIAVLGTPLNRIYPAAHLGLAEQIVAQGGALISQFASCERTYPSNFLERNRIIAGMCSGTFVAQAGERSGSLATARFALEENRDVMALPGDAIDESFAGTNKLIQSGATLVTCAQDILALYEDILSPPKIKQLASSDNTKNSALDLFLAGLTHEPIEMQEFLSLVPNDLDPHETALTLELAGKIIMLAGDMVQRVR